MHQDKVKWLCSFFMPRIARVVAKGYPHHVTQRGNYSQQVFEEDNDCVRYHELLKDYTKKILFKYMDMLPYV